jgi:hypothetical protein
MSSGLVRRNPAAHRSEKGVGIMARHLLATTALALTVVLFSLGASEPAKPIDQLSWLVGGVWSAQPPVSADGPQSIETRYEWTPNRGFIRFTTKFVMANGSNAGYAGDLFFDPADKTLRIWYMDEHNTITQGPMSVSGDKWTISFRDSGDIVGVTGPVDYRVDIVRTAPDTYQWTLFANVAQTWKKVFALVYQRSQA